MPPDLMDNRIDAELTPDQQAAVFKALDDLAAALPFLHDLSPEDRRRLSKMGDRRRAFVETAHVVAERFTDALPRSFDVGRFGRDIALYRALEAVEFTLNGLAERISDTRLAVGAEAMESARAVYYHTKGLSGASTLSEAAKVLGGRSARRARDSGSAPAD